jgi:hypothetical protein
VALGDELVRLRAGGCSDPVVATDTTASNGSYSFGDLLAGNYCLSSSGPVGDSRTTTNPLSVMLAAGENKRVDFGFAPEVPF